MNMFYVLLCCFLCVAIICFHCLFTCLYLIVCFWLGIHEEDTIWFSVVPGLGFGLV